MLGKMVNEHVDITTTGMAGRWSVLVIIRHHRDTLVVIIGIGDPEIPFSEYPLPSYAEDVL